MLTFAACSLPYLVEGEEKFSLFNVASVGILSQRGHGAGVNLFHGIVLFVSLAPTCSIILILQYLTAFKLIGFSPHTDLKPVGIPMAISNLLILAPFVLSQDDPKIVIAAIGSGAWMIWALGIIMMLVSLNIIKKPPIEIFMAHRNAGQGVRFMVVPPPPPPDIEGKPTDTGAAQPQTETATEKRLNALEHLGKLHSSGVLTDAEFEAEKKGILNGTSGHARTDDAEEKPQ